MERDGHVKGVCAQDRTWSTRTQHVKHTQHTRTHTSANVESTDEGSVVSVHIHERTTHTRGL